MWKLIKQEQLMQDSQNTQYNNKTITLDKTIAINTSRLLIYYSHMLLIASVLKL